MRDSSGRDYRCKVPDSNISGLKIKIPIGHHNYRLLLIRCNNRMSARFYKYNCYGRIVMLMLFLRHIRSSMHPDEWYVPSCHAWVIALRLLFESFLNDENLQILKSSAREYPSLYEKWTQEISFSQDFVSLSTQSLILFYTEQFS